MAVVAGGAIAGIGKLIGGLASKGAAAKGVMAGKGGGGLLSNVIGAGKKSMGNFTPANVATTGTGLAQVIQGGRLRRQSEAAMPASEDPEMRSAQLQAQRQARAFRTGTRSAAARNAAARQLATGQKRMMQFGAGGRKGLLQMQQVFNQSMERQAAADLQGELSYQQESNRLLGEISQRALDIQMQKHDELAARAASIGQAGRKNLGAGLGKMIGLDPMTGQPTGGMGRSSSVAPKLPKMGELQKAFSEGNQFDNRTNPSLIDRSQYEGIFGGQSGQMKPLVSVLNK